MSGKHIQIVEHTADWALLVTGDDLRQLFSHAAEGMAMLLFAEREELLCNCQRTVALEAYDAESLLVDWLSELAYWAEAEQLVTCSVEEMVIDQQHLTATVMCGKAPELDKHIKAVTYHNLAIKRTDDGLETTIVFDV